MVKKDCLFELLTEELPPKHLKTLSQALKEEVEKGLKEAGLEYQSISPYATPRRLALWIHELASHQPNHTIEKQGPSVENALDKDGKPTPAALGFAKSCQAEFEKLHKKKTDKGTYLTFTKTVTGKSVFDLVPHILKNALQKLPIQRRMRWGEGTASFIRPVHNVVLLYGNKVIPVEILGLKTNQITFGHRFHCTKNLKIKKPSDYVELMKNKGEVLVDFEERKHVIHEQLLAAAQKQGAQLFLDPELLEEVTALVEWPKALVASFPKEFLSVPKEALISMMKNHQRSFPLTDENGALKPYFITVSNIESREPAKVILGNEKVMRARSNDAKFFFEADLKKTLEQRVGDLKAVIFQAQLGTLFDKSQRVLRLIHWIGRQTKINLLDAERAALLCKTDLVTQMVGEFPELQGTMGYYYALNSGENERIANTIKEQYLPRFSGDDLPKTKEGRALAIADRIDTLVGIFGINKKPTGDKDPFGLRRAAIGIIRMMLEPSCALSFPFCELIKQSKESYGAILTNPDVFEQVREFILERLKIYWIDQGFKPDEISAVIASPFQLLDDLYDRLKSIQEFRQWKEAANLASANKRVAHLLSKEAPTLVNKEIDINVLQHPTEKHLAKLIQKDTDTSHQLFAQRKYVELLKQLSELSEPIDQFFDDVMVMVEDEKLRHQRLILLAKLRHLFLQVADISLLQW